MLHRGYFPVVRQAQMLMRGERSVMPRRANLMNGLHLCWSQEMRTVFSVYMKVSAEEIVCIPSSAIGAPNNSPQGLCRPLPTVEWLTIWF